MQNIWQTLPPHFTALAPMEGVTDVVFRQVIARAASPDLFFTEFTNVSSYASERGRHDALERLSIAGRNALMNPQDPTKPSPLLTAPIARPSSPLTVTDSSKKAQVPLIAQIWGKTPEHFSETAAALADLGFQGLDINMGCPDRHVNKAGGGAAMIRTPDLAIECIEHAKAATTLPVSVKTRLGFTYLEEYQDWLPLLLKQNLAALTVHLRTRKEMSKVPAHYELIPEIVKLRNELAPNTKLIINGDIQNRAHAKALWDKYPDVDGAMIGRGVFADPYCFRLGDAGSSVLGSHSSNRRLLDLFLYHLDLYDLRAAELTAASSRYPYEPLKHFFKVYINNFEGSKELRTRLMECKNTAELRAVLLSFYSKLSPDSTKDPVS